MCESSAAAVMPKISDPEQQQTPVAASSSAAPQKRWEDGFMNGVRGMLSVYAFFRSRHEKLTAFTIPG